MNRQAFGPKESFMGRLVIKAGLAKDEEGANKVLIYISIGIFVLALLVLIF